MDRRAAIQIADRIVMQAGLENLFLNNAAFKKVEGRKVWIVVYDTPDEEEITSNPTAVVVEVDDQTGVGRIAPV